MSSLLQSHRAEFLKLAKLALPISIASAGQSFMSLVDTAVVGRLGTTSLAAVGLSNAVFFGVASFTTGLMLGIDPLVSQALGGGNASRARALLWQGAYLAMAVGVLFALPFMVLPWLLPLLGVHFVELPEVQDYLPLRAASLPLLLLFMVMRCYLQATERTSALVVSTVVANLVNLGANILLVFGGAGLPAFLGPLRLVPAMGVKGAAIATLLCSILQCVIVALAVRRVRVPGGLPSRRLVRADILQAVRVGVPIGMHVAAEVGVFALAGVLARWMGPESMGAHQIALAYGTLTFTAAMGVGSAGSVRVGWAVGARDTAQARLRGRVALLTGAGVMSLSALMFALFPLPLARLMGAPPEVVPLAVPLLMVCAVFQLSDGLQGVGAGVLRGVGDTRFTFAANMVGHYFIGLPVALLLGFGLGYGVLGIWWGLCAGLTAVALALVWRFERLSAGTLRPLEA